MPDTKMHFVFLLYSPLCYVSCPLCLPFVFFFFCCLENFLLQSSAYGEYRLVNFPVTIATGFLIVDVSLPGFEIISGTKNESRLTSHNKKPR